MGRCACRHVAVKNPELSVRGPRPPVAEAGSGRPGTLAAGSCSLRAETAQQRGLHEHPPWSPPTVFSAFFPGGVASRVSPKPSRPPHLGGPRSTCVWGAGHCLAPLPPSDTGGFRRGPWGCWLSCGRQGGPGRS